jgi:uncharacterized damage-inducible protein DinB
MKEILTSYAAYEIWANKRLLDVIMNIGSVQQEQEIKSSFPSIYKTCLHMWDASAIWWQRLHKKEQIAVPSLSFHPTMAEVAQELVEQNEQWLQWIQNASDSDIEAELPYKNMKGEPFIQPVKHILLHISNHGTYHRGQLVTMLRQVGVEKVPQTDYIVFSRS